MNQKFYITTPIYYPSDKLLRVINTMLKTGKPYDPEKLLKDIRYPENVQTAAA